MIHCLMIIAACLRAVCLKPLVTETNLLCPARLLCSTCFVYKAFSFIVDVFSNINIHIQHCQICELLCCIISYVICCDEWLEDPIKK